MNTNDTLESSRMRQNPEPQISLAAARRPIPAVQKQPRTNRTLLALGVLLLLGAGAVLGGLIVRQRYKSREIIAAVNGQTFTKEDLFHRLDQSAGPQTLHQMVSEELTLQFAQQKRVTPSDAEVNAEYARLAAEPDFELKMGAQGLSTQDVKRSLRVTLAHDALINQGMTVTEDEIRKFYDRNIAKDNPAAQFYTPESILIAVIVTPTAVAAQQAWGDIQQGKPFGAVAKMYSIDASAVNGGAIPWAARGRSASRKVPGLEDALFGLAVGKEMPPRRFAGAWWIVRCLDKKPALTQSFAAVKEECRRSALLSKGLPANGKRIESEFAAFHDKATLQAFWPRYKVALTTKLP